MQFVPWEHLIGFLYGPQRWVEDANGKQGLQLAVNCQISISYWKVTCVVSRDIFTRYFGEPVGRVKIQETSKIIRDTTHLTI